MTNTEMIKELRSITQAGMKDCADALKEANYDLQKAIDIVKIKGLNIVSGREGKVASEGGIGIIISQERTGSMVEVNCQTDFVAKSPDFTNFIGTVAIQLANCIDEDEIFNIEDCNTAKNNLIATTKENIVVRRWWVEEALDPNARVFAYLHSNKKIGVLLTLMASSEQAANDSAFKDLGNDLAMQIAAMSPLSVSSDRLDPEVIARQKTIFETQLTEANKPQAAWTKILEGKFNKYFSEVCLENQESVVVPKTIVKQVVKNVGDKLGGEIKIVNFIRCQVGEGIEQETKTNLADEVANMTGVK